MREPPSCVNEQAWPSGQSVDLIRVCGRGLVLPSAAHQVHILGVARDVGGHEGADRNDPEALLARPLETGPCQRVADPLPLVGTGHLSVGEDDLVAEELVFEDRRLTCAVNRETVLVDLADNLERGVLDSG